MLDTPNPAPEAHGGKGLLQLAREIGHRESLIAAGNARPDAEDRMTGEISDRLHAIAERRPSNAREALVVAAVAAGEIRDLAGPGDIYQRRALRLAMHLVGWLQDAAGVTAADLGVGCFADCHDGPAYSEDEIAAGNRELMVYCTDAGYLAAVARYAPSQYASVKRDIERERAAGAAGLDVAAHELADATGDGNECELVGFAAEARPTA